MVIINNMNISGSDSDDSTSTVRGKDEDMNNHSVKKNGEQNWKKEKRYRQ